MGQHQTTNTLLSNWQQHPLESEILFNLVTNQQIHRHYVKITDNQQLRHYSNRMHQHYTYICRVIYYHPAPECAYEQNPKIFFVYTDRMLPIRDWHSDVSLSIMKGFRRLHATYGSIRVQRNMIGQNQRGEVKVWLNSNPVLNYAQNVAQSQEQMLADIAGILMIYNKKSAGFLIGCKNFSDAIRNLSRPNDETSQYTKHFSYRPDIQDTGNAITVQQYQQHKNRHISPVCNNEYWTVRNQNTDQRNYISQGKRKIPIEGPVATKNSNFSMKHAQNSLGKKNYVPNVQPVNSYLISSPRNQKQERQGSNVKNLGESGGSNNTSLSGYSQNSNKDYRYPMVYGQKYVYNQNKSPDVTLIKQQNRNLYEIPKMVQQRKKYTSTYVKKQKNQGQGQNKQQQQYRQNNPQLQSDCLNNMIISTDTVYQTFEQVPHYVNEQSYGYYQNEMKERQQRNRNISPRKTDNNNNGNNNNNHGNNNQINDQKNDRVQTFSDIHDALKFYQFNNPRNKTQQFNKPKNDIPSFIPRKKQQHLNTDHISNDLKSLNNLDGQKNQIIIQKRGCKGSDINIINKIQNKNMGDNFIFKKDTKSQKGKDNQQKDQKLLRRLEKQQRILQQIKAEKKKQKDNIHNNNNNNNYQYNIIRMKSKQGKNLLKDLKDKQIIKTNIQPSIQSLTYKNSQQSQGSKKLNNQQNLSGLSKSSQQHNIKNNKINKNQIIQPPSLENSGENQNNNVQNQQKKKLKQEMAKQLKMEFGSILSWDTEEIKDKPKDQYHQKNNEVRNNPKKNSHDQKSQVPKSTSKAKIINKHERDLSQASNQDSQRREKIQNIISKYAQGTKDQLIKQKVQKKKATFAQLKKQAMKILSDDMF